MNDQEKFTPQFEQGKDLHILAEQVRNPYQGQLREIADEYSEKLRALLPEGSIVDLGGSLLSNTALKGHNDIDLRILLPKKYATEEKIREISNAINDIVPFRRCDQLARRAMKNSRSCTSLNLKKKKLKAV